ncbi:uncharacterized protein [Dermacentor albipictus]|uniref:uncharacterized protein isoform X2 n=1 Tax=Dermacentor albipictus TaxID=60249 RepID=UPI0031FBACCE
MNQRKLLRSTWSCARRICWTKTMLVFIASSPGHESGQHGGLLYESGWQDRASLSPSSEVAHQGQGRKKVADVLCLKRESPVARGSNNAGTDSRAKLRFPADEVDVVVPCNASVGRRRCWPFVRHHRAMRQCKTVVYCASQTGKIWWPADLATW